MKKILIEGMENIVKRGFEIGFEVVEVVDDNEIIILNDGCEETYLVFENEDEAIDYAKDKLENDYTICPKDFLEGLSEWVLMDNIDDEGVKNWWSDLYQEECWNEAIECLVDDETLELIENGELEEDEARESEFNARMESIQGSEVDEMIYQFGRGQFLEMAINHEWFNIEDIIDDIISYDGVAPTLAIYDGEEQQSEINEVVAYRID